MVCMLQNSKTSPRCNRFRLRDAKNFIPSPYHALLVDLRWDVLIFVPKQNKSRGVRPRRITPYLAQTCVGEIRGEKVVIPLSLSIREAAGICDYIGACKRIEPISRAWGSAHQFPVTSGNYFFLSSVLNHRCSMSDIFFPARIAKFEADKFPVADWCL